MSNSQQKQYAAGVSAQIVRINDLFQQMNLAHKRNSTQDSIEQPIFQLPVQPTPKESAPPLSDFQKYMLRKQDLLPPARTERIESQPTYSILKKTPTETSIQSSRSFASNSQSTKTMSQRDMHKAQRNKMIIEQAYQNFVEKKKNSSKSPSYPLQNQLQSMFKHKANPCPIKTSATPEQSRRSLLNTVKKNYFIH